MKLLIDVGGSGVKIVKCVKGKPSGRVRSFKPTLLKEFYSCIFEMAHDEGASQLADLDGIAVSICGEYDYAHETVLNCWHYPFLTGELGQDLKAWFRCRKVRIVNDGDAHALALKAAYAQKKRLCASAVNLALGTAVGMGILDWTGRLLHTCQGHDWEVSPWQMDTTAKEKALYWALGSEGLCDLESRYGNPDAYVIYGHRLCHFLAHDLVPVFRPRIIGLSGGIVAGHLQEIKEGVKRECDGKNYCEPGGVLAGVEFYWSMARDSVMLGLAELL